jgi:hypothetical protein
MAAVWWLDAIVTASFLSIAGMAWSQGFDPIVLGVSGPVDTHPFASDFIGSD